MAAPPLAAPSTAPIAPKAALPLVARPTGTPPLPKGITFAGVLVATSRPPVAVAPPGVPAKAATAAKVEPEPERPTRARRAPREEPVDPLDPATRTTAHLAPPATFTIAAAAAVSAPSAARLSLEEIMPQLVKRIAWAGDKRKGSVRLELGAGVYAGSTITVHAEDGRVRLEVEGAEGLRDKLDARLRRRGLVVE